MDWLAVERLDGEAAIRSAVRSCFEQGSVGQASGEGTSHKTSAIMQAGRSPADEYGSTAVSISVRPNG